MVRVCLVLCGVAAARAAVSPSFEVASIKATDPNPDNPSWIGMTADGAMVTYTSITLKACIRAAYGVRDFQIAGPDWMSTARFAIKAKLPAGASMDQIPEMLQSLLAERFKLVIRHDTKEQSVYVLTIGNSGAKLKPAPATPPNQAPTALGPDGKPRQPMVYRYSASGVVLTAASANLASFVGLISRFTAHPVVDMTGLDGHYELSLGFTPEAIDQSFVAAAMRTPAFTEPGPSVFDAVKELGFRLEARKVPIEMLTVMRVEKTPTED